MVQWVNLALADSLIERCLAQSHVHGWPSFSIAVVDAGGALVLLRRQDGASSVTAEAAVLKARTAVRLGASTQALVEASKDSHTRDLLLMLQLTDDPGGEPIQSASHIIGGIGVSGGSAEQDTGCANLAIKSLTPERK